MTDLIVPLADFDPADNTTYKTETYFGAEYLTNLNGLAAEQGLELYSDKVADYDGWKAETDAAAAIDEGNRDEAAAARRATEWAWIETALPKDHSAADGPGRQQAMPCCVEYILCRGKSIKSIVFRGHRLVKV